MNSLQQLPQSEPNPGFNKWVKRIPTSKSYMGLRHFINHLILAVGENFSADCDQIQETLAFCPKFSKAWLVTSESIKKDGLRRKDLVIYNTDHAGLKCSLRSFFFPVWKQNKNPLQSTDFFMFLTWLGLQPMLSHPSSGDESVHQEF